MLYRFLQFLMRKSLLVHYLEVKGIGISTIPKEGPLMIAASHPNSFLDAIIIAVLINRPLHFLARSDVFGAKWANYILRKLNLIPIYRMQEGHGNLNRNDQTFNECHKILEKGGAIIIFVEGVSLTDMKLRPLKKGLARISFGFTELHQFAKECYIAPIALNYDRPTEFRSKVTAAVGNVIKVSDYTSIYQKNNNKGFMALNEAIFHELKTHTIEVEEKNYMVYKAMAELDSCFEQNSLSRKILIAEHVQDVSRKNSEEFNELKSIIENAFSILKDYKLNFRKLKINHGVSMKESIFLIITSPLAITAFIANFLPMYFSKLITDKTVKLDEFYASVRLVLGSILWIIWASGITVILMLYVHIAFFLTPVLLYLGAKFYLSYYEKAKYARAAYRLGRLKSNSDKYNQLQLLIKQVYRIRTGLGLAPAS